MKFKDKILQRVYDHALTLNPNDLHGLGTTSATFQSGYKFGLNGHIGTPSMAKLKIQKLMQFIMLV